MTVTYTTEQVAELLGISPKTVRKLVKANLLKPMEGIRHFHFTEGALMRYTRPKRIPRNN